MSLQASLHSNHTYYIMKIHPNRTESYRFSATNDAEGCAHIAQLRKEIRILNLEEKIKSLKDSSHVRKVSKVDIFGRLGKNNVNAQSYRDAAKKQRKTWGFGAYAYQRIAIADAATLDVYVRTYTL
jgi:hypothetical protein